MYGNKGGNNHTKKECQSSDTFLTNHSDTWDYTNQTHAAFVPSSILCL